MCLQYAIWAMASYLNDKYGEYTEVFYLRARQYADADEMKASFGFIHPSLSLNTIQSELTFAFSGLWRAFHNFVPCAGLLHPRKL
jgi:hypothetical protein